jgi:hypothetical protein
MDTEKIQLDRGVKKALGDEFLAYFGILEEDFIEVEALLDTYAGELGSDEIIDYMLSTDAIRSLSIIGELGGVLSERLTATINEMIDEQERRIDELKARIQKIEIADSASAVPMFSAGVGASMFMPTLSHSSKTSNHRLRKRKSTEEIVAVAVENFSKAYGKLVDTVRAKNRAILYTLLQDAFRGMQVFEAIKARDASVEFGIDRESRHGLNLEIDLLEESVGMDTDAQYTQKDRELMADLMRTMLFARTLELHEAKPQEQEGCSLKEVADECYRKLCDALVKSKRLMGDEVEIESDLPISKITFSKGDTFVSCLNGEVFFTLPNGIEVEMPFSVSRLTSELVARGSWSNSLRKIFKEYNVEDYYEQVRGLVFISVVDLTDLGDEDEEEVSEWDGWWLKYEGSSIEEDVEEDTLDKLELIAPKKGMRTKISGVALGDAKRAFEYMGYEFEKGGIDYVVRGDHFETGGPCRGIFPGDHGKNNCSANKPAAIRHLCRKLGIPREIFLMALADS